MKHSRKINIVLVAIAAVIAYFCLIPLLFMVFTSFKGMSESISSATLFPKVWTMENYTSLLADVATALYSAGWLIRQLSPASERSVFWLLIFWRHMPFPDFMFPLREKSSQ